MKHNYTPEQMRAEIAEAKAILQQVDLPDEPLVVQARRMVDQYEWQAGIARGYEKQIQQANETLRDQLSALRPISEAGQVPDGCLRVYVLIKMEGYVINPVMTAPTHFADIRLPEASQPATFEAHGKTWTRHTPGDPMPCDGGRMVECLYGENHLGKLDKGQQWNWDTHTTVKAWRYADEPTPEPDNKIISDATSTPEWTPKVGDVVQSNPVQDMALGGQMYWRDLARQLAQVWWKCHNIGASLQHGDIDTDVSFSIVCERHGGQVFHADTPLNAWLKAEKWLMSPDRANFPTATLQPA